MASSVQAAIVTLHYFYGIFEFMRVIKWAFGVFSVGAFLTFAGVVVWSDYIEPRICPASERMVTEEAALAFGKQYFRGDAGFLQYYGISGEEAERILQGKCCSAMKGDYFIKDNSRWNVYVGATTQNGINFDYEVLFSECGKHVRTETLVQQASKQ
jgi:hypothetical protein